MSGDRGKLWFSNSGGAQNYGTDHGERERERQRSVIRSRSVDNSYVSELLGDQSLGSLRVNIGNRSNS